MFLIHAFTDGRDTDPKMWTWLYRRSENHLNETTGTIATVSGRYYAMDRDKRWERVKLAYDALVNGSGEKQLMQNLQLNTELCE
jgi:2,3-bisphosphoglycerate-independent phosphoglycerate mutase